MLYSIIHAYLLASWEIRQEKGLLKIAKIFRITKSDSKGSMWRDTQKQTGALTKVRGAVPRVVIRWLRQLTLCQMQQLFG